MSKQNIIERDDDVPEDEILKKFNPGDKVKAIITELNPEKQRLSLSIRDFHKKEQRAELSKYIQNETDEAKVTLGDFLKDKGNDSFEN